jgi:hypothetical protein
MTDFKQKHDPSSFCRSVEVLSERRGFVGHWYRNPLELLGDDPISTLVEEWQHLLASLRPFYYRSAAVFLLPPPQFLEAIKEFEEKQSLILVIIWKMGSKWWR